MADMKTVTINGVTYKIEDPEALSGTDTTLTQANKAADAAAVGTALGKKAPAGYGLGGNSTNAPTNNDANQAVYNGFFSAFSSTQNAPKVDGTMLVESRAWGQTYQTIKQHGTGCVLQRCQKSGVWSEWEWRNPPMAVGVEYRTTKRFKGKPVYTILMELGQLPSNSTKAVDLPCEYGDVGDVVSMDGCVYNEATLETFPLSGYTDMSIYVQDCTVHINHNGSSNYNCRAILEYTVVE